MPAGPERQRAPDGRGVARALAVVVGAVLVAGTAYADEPEHAPLRFPADHTAAALDQANLARLIELHDRDDERRRARVTTADAWAKRRSELGKSVRQLLGLEPPPPRTPLAARTTGVLHRDGYRIEKIVFESRPGMPVPANLYLPEGTSAPDPPWPAVLCPVGHWRLSKAQPVVQARAVGLAKLGFAALVYDALGQGERAVPGNEHTVAYLAGLLGESNMTYMVWDSVRALDYLETRTEIDPKRLGVTGCSGGGLNTLYLVAADSRLHAAAPVGYVCSFASFLKTGITHCPCSHVPSMAVLTDMDEIIGLLAPHPVLVMGGKTDSMFTEAGTREAFARIGELYEFAGAPARAAELLIDDCGHDYSRPMRERAYGFFQRHLLATGTGAAIPEPNATDGWKAETVEALACFDRGKVPASATTYRQIVLARIAAAGGQGDLGVSANLSSCTVGMRSKEWRDGPLSVEPLAKPFGATWVTDARGLRHRTITRSHPNAGATVLVLEDGALGDATPALLASLAGDQKVRVVALEPPFWRSGGNTAHLARTNGLLLGQQPAALWVRSLLWHAQRERAAGRRVVIFARGKVASLMGLIATVIYGRYGQGIDGLVASGAPATWPDVATRPAAFLRGAGYAGDVADFLRATAPRRVLWSGTSIAAELPKSVEVRESAVDVSEAADWLESFVGERR